jgi:iron complex outermembrane recepter protein
MRDSQTEFSGALRAAIGWFWLACSATVGAADDSLADLSLEELANTEITSVSRRAERLSEAPASVYVITAEAIRRSGATSLPQALRLAPNLQVAQLDASQYAITARGFNNAIGNKLLVLIDGRTVYTPFFSGVFWDQQDVLLADVKRIEVISGPGATLWGANAVNGVINVITRSAAETEGALLVGAAGSRETRAGARFGGAAPGAGHYRVYALHTRRENTRDENSASLSDGWDSQQIGFRADWGGTSSDFTLQGDAYRGETELRHFPFPGFPAAIEASGYNLLGRWTHRLDDGATLRVQAYVDHSERDDALLYKPEVDIADIEFQHALRWSAHKLVWGGGYRHARDDVQPGLFFGFRPPQRELRWSNLFVQDEIALLGNLELTLGVKLERNDYTGTESLPSARLAWKPARDHLVWGALSRAVRAPARLDRDITLPPNPPFIIAGGPDFVSEVANVVELGWRATPRPDLSLSITAFHHHWERLRSGQLPPNAMVQNMISGTTHGVEAWGVWQASPAWRLSAGFTTFRADLGIDPGSADPVGPSALGNDPEYQWMLRSSLNPWPGHEFDLAVRRVAALPDPVVPAYTALDLRYGWRVTPDFTVSLVGRNLLDGGHAEFGAAAGRSVIPRSVLLHLRWEL